MFYIILKDHCKWCDLAKEVLNSRGEEFKEIPLEDNHYLIDLFAKVDYKTVPRIYYDKTYIGGYEDLLKYLDH